MSLGHGAKIVTDSLVFAYDMGGKQSFKGKPTTNIIADAGKNCAAEYSGSSYPFVNQNITSQVQAAWSSSNPTFSMQFEGYRDYVGGGSGGGNDGYPVMYIYFTDWSWSTTISRTTYDWSYTGKSFTMPDPTGKSVYFAIYHMNSGNRGRSYARNFQIEHNAFPTTFVNGTRSNTEAIIDWAGKNNISPVDLIYTSDNKFIFNGLGETDGSPLGSYIPIPTSVSTTNPSTKPNGVTYDFWIKADTDAPDRMGLIVGSGTINHIEIYSSGKYFRTEAVTQNGYSFGSGGFPNSCRGVWSHFSIVFANNETNRPVRWYQNGELFYTHSNMGSGTDVNQYFQPSRLGSATGSGSYLYAPSFKGEFPVFKSYDKTLTDQEIKQNFNALRGRFGI
jgi:hypothetical protein